MHPMLNIAVRAARAAGSVITRGYENRDDLDIQSKGAQDYVTKIDKEAELTIIEKIKKSYPDHAFIGEEGGRVEGNNEFVWVIDPLDGTSNFIAGIPHFAVSIALLHKGKLDQGVVFDPIRGELFAATKGSGAQLNGYRLRCSKAKDLSNTILATAIPFRDKSNLDADLANFAKVFKDAGDVRRSGSAALDLAYVAAGRYDGYWEKGLQSWDMAAGELLVKEAGGLVTDYAGNNDPLYDEIKQAGSSNGIVAGNPRVVQNIVKRIK
ncbi:inositol-1-monophosphatase [Glaciecola petra]|uniref:Inositol-1-monophosphatase n=1 Tax=Glaciecola petra TaxID=3075602 RepID=A0ABU2ZWT3_9ALTE|nr:inositol-1-monophosphatase [Aestuariibacter sp. P117]MDT0595882.1 inositol-1-monophosphatase [Aestuariibacter sp. P117]